MAGPPSTPPDLGGTGTGTIRPTAFGLSRLSKIQPGTGSGSARWAGAGALRRKVVLTTRCNTLALNNVRMNRWVPGTGSGGWEYAGTGTHRRKVVEIGECQGAGRKPGTGSTPLDLGPYIPPNYTPHGGGAWSCCGNEYDSLGVPFPDKLSAYIARVHSCSGLDAPRQCCIDLDDFATNLYFVGFDSGNRIIYRSQVSWITVQHPSWVLGPGLVPVYSGSYREVVSIQVQLVGECANELLYWTISVVGYPASGLGFYTFLRGFLGPGNGGLSTCARPFPIYFGGGANSIEGPARLYIQRGVTWGYDPCNVAAGMSMDEYKVVVTAPFPSGTVTMPGYPPNIGTGTGTGTHAPHGTRPYSGVVQPKASAGMSKWLTFTASGRRVVGQACCSGTGTGTAKSKPPLSMLITDTGSGTCCMHGGTIHLSLSSSGAGYAGTATCNGCTWNFFLFYDGVDWKMDITSNCGCGTFEITMTTHSTTPLDLSGTVTLGGCNPTTGCLGATLKFDVTGP